VTILCRASFQIRDTFLPGPPTYRAGMHYPDIAMTHDATQDRFLGAILGLAIGDAFGMPVAGRSKTTIADWYGSLTGYLPRKFPDGTEVGAGEITDETEIALCIIESFTASQGELDPENIGIRMSYLARGDSRKWMSEQTLIALDGVSEANEYQLPLVDDERVSGEVAVRGIPIGLMHSIGATDRARLTADASVVSRITHGSPLALSAVEAVALATSTVSRQMAAPNELRGSLLAEMADGEVREALAAASDSEPDPADSVAAVIASAVGFVEIASSFEECIQIAAELGGASESRAAFAGSLYAGYHGTASIPQRLIDDLEARIYISLAVPWFYRTVARRSGRLIDLRRSSGFDS
jgi:ADP-ribosyl-[dinitrogen reductase] hydrolase